MMKKKKNDRIVYVVFLLLLCCNNKTDMKHAIISDEISGLYFQEEINYSLIKNEKQAIRIGKEYYKNIMINEKNEEYYKKMNSIIQNYKEKVEIDAISNLIYSAKKYNEVWYVRIESNVVNKSKNNSKYFHYSAFFRTHQNMYGSIVFIKINSKDGKFLGITTGK